MSNALWRTDLVEYKCYITNITIAFINWYRYLSIAILERKLLGALAMATFIKKKPDPGLIKVEMKMCR